MNPYHIKKLIESKPSTNNLFYSHLTKMIEDANNPNILGNHEVSKIVGQDKFLTSRTGELSKLIESIEGTTAISGLSTTTIQSAIQPLSKLKDHPGIYKLAQNLSKTQSLSNQIFGDRKQKKDISSVIERITTHENQRLTTFSNIAKTVKLEGLASEAISKFNLEDNGILQYFPEQQRSKILTKFEDYSIAYNNLIGNRR